MQEDPGTGGAAPGIDTEVAVLPGAAGAEYTWARDTTEAMPGNPETIREHAGLLETRATDLRDHRDEIRRLEPDWTGPASDAFQELKETLPPRMELASERFDSIAAALYDYADELDGARDDANGARDAARPLVDELEDAEVNLANAEEALEGATIDEWQEANPDEPWLYGDDPAGEVSGLHSQIEDHWSDFTAAFDRRWTAAETCTESIEESTGTEGATRALNDDGPVGRAADDLAELGNLLDDVGIDISDFDPDSLDDLDLDDETTRHVLALVRDIDERSGDDLYAEEFFGGLDAEGVRAVLGTVEMLDTQVEEDLVTPFVDGFALATPTMDRDVLDDLNDPEEGWHWHQLSVLVSGDASDYEPEFLAGAADNLLGTSDAGRPGRPHEADLDDYPPLGISSGGHIRLRNRAHNDRRRDWPVTAYEALGDNPEAALAYTRLGVNRIDALLHPVGAGQGSTLGTSQEAVEEAAVGAYDAAFVDAPQLEEVSFSSEIPYDMALDSYADVVTIVGEGDVPDPLREAVAGSFLGYADDIAVIGPGQRSTGDFSRPALVAFSAELAESGEAMEVLARDISLWGAQRAQVLVNEPNYTGAAVQQAFEPFAAVNGALLQGIDVSNEPDTAHNAWAAGLGIGAGILAAGLMTLPEPGTTAAGFALASYGAAQSQVISRTSSGAETTTSEGTDIDSTDIQERMVLDLRIAVAEAIVEHRGDDLGLEMPDVPNIGDWVDADAGRAPWYFDLATILEASSPEYADDPVYVLDGWIQQEMNYNDPSNQEWSPE